MSVMNEAELRKRIDNILNDTSSAEATLNSLGTSYTAAKWKREWELTRNKAIDALLDLYRENERVARKKLYVPSLTEETYAYLKFLFTPYYGERAYWAYKYS